MNNEYLALHAKDKHIYLYIYVTPSLLIRFKDQKCLNANANVFQNPNIFLALYVNSLTSCRVLKRSTSHNSMSNKNQTS